MLLGSNAFYWSSIQINKNTISKPHRDYGNEGLSFIAIFGDCQGGELTIDKEIGRMEMNFSSLTDTSCIGRPPLLERDTVSFRSIIEQRRS